MAALEQTNWIVAGPNGAAARLGMKRSTLQSRMQKLGIRIARTGTEHSDGAISGALTAMLKVTRCQNRYVP